MTIGRIGLGIIAALGWAGAQGLASSAFAQTPATNPPSPPAAAIAPAQGPTLDAHAPQ